MSDYQLIFNPLASSGFTLVPTAEYISSLADVTSENIISALGYTPYDGTTNPNNYLTASSLSSSDITTTLGYTPIPQVVSPTSGDIAIVDAFGNIADSEKTFSTDSTLSSNSDSLIPTQKAVKTYADNLLTLASALVFKGTLDLSTNPDYPSGNTGDVYAISVSGKIGGDSGLDMTMGDLLLCITDNDGGTYDDVGSDWTTVQLSLNGIVLGPTESVSGDIVLFDGTSGSVIEDSGVSISTDGTLVSNSDSLLSTQKAIVTFVTSGLSTKQNTITTGTNLQYLAGDLSLITFPTNVSTFYNDSGYLTSATGVSSFNTRHGAVTLTNTDVANAMGYTPANIISSPTLGEIVLSDAYGLLTGSSVNISTDGTMASDSDSYVSTQKAIVTYIASNPQSYLTSVTGVASFNTRHGSVTLSSSDVTTALGFTPYNSTNPSGYLTSSTGVTTVNTFYGAITLNNIDSSITVTPLGGTVTFSLNINNANTWTATQTLSACNLATDTTTGMQIGTSTSQKIGFYGATPIVQPTGDIKTALTNLGLVGTPTISQADITSLVASGKTVTFNNSITFAGTDSTTMTFPGTSDTVVVLGVAQTLTNKRVTKRTTLSSGSAVTFTPASDSYDIYEFATTASAGTLTVVNPTGTPTDGQALVLRIKTTNAMTYSWGNQYRTSTSTILPVNSSGSSLTDYISFIYNSADSIWDIAGVSNGH